jgi:hypothetical protein
MPYGEFPPNVVELIQRQLSQFGRVGATKLYNVPALAAPIAAVVGTIAQAAALQFREPGTIIAMYGQELTATPAKFASTALRVQVGGQEDLFTDGNTGAFVPMLALFGPNLNWFPIWRRVEPGINWVISYRNDDGGATATPFCTFAFIADADLARNMPG